MPSLSPVIIEPQQSATACVIWLHGLGADANDFVPVVPMLGHDFGPVRFIFPNAPMMPISANGGMAMRAWFDLVALDFLSNPDEFSEPPGMQDSVNAIQALVNEQIQQGIAAANIILVGFSQGAAIALLAGLSFDQSLAGIIALSGFLPMSAKVHGVFSTQNRQTPLLICHGRNDPVIPYLLAERTHAGLEKMGYNSSFHAYSMAHTVIPGELRQVGTFIDQVLR